MWQGGGEGHMGHISLYSTITMNCMIAGFCCYNDPTNWTLFSHIENCCSLYGRREDAPVLRFAWSATISGSNGCCPYQVLSIIRRCLIHSRYFPFWCHHWLGVCVCVCGWMCVIFSWLKRHLRSLQILDQCHPDTLLLYSGIYLAKIYTHTRMWKRPEISADFFAGLLLLHIYMRIWHICWINVATDCLVCVI